jgi:hypothetical protein
VENRHEILSNFVQNGVFLRRLEMLTVEDYEKIRKAVKIQGMSERQAARKFGHSRKTIKKALENSVPPGYAKRSSPAGVFVMNDIYGRIVDKLLEKNKKIPRKQRMTGTKIHQILVEQYDFLGCVQTVRRSYDVRRSISSWTSRPARRPRSTGEKRW